MRQLEIKVLDDGDFSEPVSRYFIFRGMNQLHVYAECLLCVNALGFFSFKDPFNIKSVWNLCNNK